MRIYESFRYDFTAEEKQQLGQQLALEVTSLADNDRQKKEAAAHFAAKHKAIESNCFELSAKLTNGYEMRQFEVMVMLDTPRPGWKRIIRVDSNEAVRDEPMTFAEMQRNLGFEEES
jgi:hypothetical protein